MKKLFSKMDKPLLFAIIAFFIFGLVMVLSASSMESYMRYGYDPYHYFYRQAIFIGIGSFLFYIILHIPTKVYKKMSPLLIIGIIICISSFIIITLNITPLIHNTIGVFAFVGTISLLITLLSSVRVYHKIY